MVCLGNVSLCVFQSLGMEPQCTAGKERRAGFSSLLESLLEKPFQLSPWRRQAFLVRVANYSILAPMWFLKNGAASVVDKEEARFTAMVQKPSQGSLVERPSWICLKEEYWFVSDYISQDCLLSNVSQQNLLLAVLNRVSEILIGIGYNYCFPAYRGLYAGFHMTKAS